MLDSLTYLPLRLALLPAVLFTPFLLLRLSAPTLGIAARLAVTGALSLLLNTAAPLGLQWLGVPIHAPALAALHWSLFLLVCAALAARSAMRQHAVADSREVAPANVAVQRATWIPAVVFALLVFPFTHLAGIDTYKWQDLATSVRVEQSIPWLVHPLSLFGFTPRAYPGIQPLTLASIQILGGLGVEGGYYLMSLLSGLTGLFAALWLGEILFAASTPATLFGVLYAFSPVFLRYNHWATGRGVFVALLPLFLIACVRLPRMKAILALPVLAAMLCMAHKAGIVAVPLILAALPFGWILPRRDVRFLRLLLAVPFAAAAFLLAGSGLTAAAKGVAWQSLTRFGWYVPAGLSALFFVREWWSRPAWRALFVPALAAFPLACHREMYGALVALPFVSHAATVAVAAAIERWPHRRTLLVRGALALTAIGALAIVGSRSFAATPRDVWQAAMFLERYDPLGPFRIDADDAVRTRIQGYCSGCPRFSVSREEASSVTLRRPPPMRGAPRAVAQAWIDYLRHALTAGDGGTDWYGTNPRLYWVVVNGSAARPGARLLFRTGSVEVYAPAAQPEPSRLQAPSLSWRRP